MAEARPVQPMLLIIDMLVDFLERWPAADRAALVAAIRALADAFRAAGHPVAWVRQEFAPDLSAAFGEMRRDNIRVTIKGTPGSRIIAELAPAADDLQVVKTRYSAFFGTPLDEIIRANGIDTLVLAGVNTHACVRMTAIDALPILSVRLRLHRLLALRARRPADHGACRRRRPAQGVANAGPAEQSKAACGMRPQGKDTGDKDVGSEPASRAGTGQTDGPRPCSRTCIPRRNCSFCAACS
jgi:nicotinamidase-related amidase